jgi:hypothetical protein
LDEEIDHLSNERVFDYLFVAGCRLPVAFAFSPPWSDMDI